MALPLVLADPPSDEPAAACLPQHSGAAPPTPQRGQCGAERRRPHHHRHGFENLGCSTKWAAGFCLQGKGDLGCSSMWRC
ncbi:unnamed protein product [Urochloa humidicola]